MCWVMRRNFRIPSEEELRRLVTPENVCPLLLLLSACWLRSLFSVNVIVKVDSLSDFSSPFECM